MPVPNVADGQDDYDSLMEALECDKEEDTLNCLRQTPSKWVQDALAHTKNPFDYSGIAMASWSPRADGKFLPERPLLAVADDRIAQIPAVLSTTDDEGTWFAWASTNVS